MAVGNKVFDHASQAFQVIIPKLHVGKVTTLRCFFLASKRITFSTEKWTTKHIPSFDCDKMIE